MIGGKSDLGKSIPLALSFGQKAELLLVDREGQSYCLPIPHKVDPTQFQGTGQSSALACWETLGILSSLNLLSIEASVESH